jgi:hypothetical protein
MFLLMDEIELSIKSDAVDERDEREWKEDGRKWAGESICSGRGRAGDLGWAFLIRKAGSDKRDSSARFC